MKYKRIRWLLLLLVTTLVGHAQTTTPLTDNGDGTWTLAVMPGYNVKLVIEHEDAFLPVITTKPVAKTGLVYNGKAQELVTAGTANGGVMNYSLDGENFSADIPTATFAGTYTVYYKAASTTPNCGDTPVQTLTVEIAQLTDFTDNGDGTWTLAAMPVYDVKLVVDCDFPLLQGAPKAKTELVYTGESQELITAGTAINGVLKYSLDGETFSTDIPTAAELGIYTVYYKVESTVPDCDDTPVQTLTVEIAQLTGFTDNGDGTWTLAAMPEYNVKLIVEYEVATLPVITTEPVAKTGLVYNGKMQELITQGETNGGVMNYSLDGENFSTDIPTATTSGIYTVYYKAASTTPNCGDTPVQTLKVEIAQLTDFTDNGDGTWTLVAMPEYDVKLVVEYVDEQVNLTANSDGEGNYWVTYYNGTKGYVADDNTTVYTAKLSEDKAKVVLTEVTDKAVPAGNAVVMKSTATDITLTYDATATGTLADNELKGSDTQVVTLENTYMLVGGASGVGFYRWRGGYIPAGKAYLRLIDYNAALSRMFIPFTEGDGEVTGIGAMSGTDGDADGTYYDLTGRKVGKKPTAPGIYVINGKKVVIK